MKQYVVDAFTDKVFKGNPAAVCILPEWIPDMLMQNIAQENNLSETAFTVKRENIYELRWFTPGGEIDLCGHATLGTAYVLFRFIEKDSGSISFQTKSGQLIVKKVNDLYEMDMPAYPLTEVPVTDEMELAIGFRPSEAWLGRDLVCVMADEQQVLQAIPNEERLKELDGLLLQLTAKGTTYDCVTRSFAPKLNVLEDPVCGSGHCHVIPLWANKIKKRELIAFQASKRSGVLYCRIENDRVILAGKAILYSKAEIYVP
ncbi:PhzF family phenazine biosynthesis protein [Eisenbergiella massiliensis]|uniref:PhzF family phenazine biosynthesis protein n=1 Tax=Eisenbergiella massiliensis TaxID=1720294 RepID=A0A3E3I569_9FIRM|nr:PhzF family phenazine biosynthesis protein [Eisenbergiella porci]RGE60437.1 PhzF family phenazine biosynthesis protein [Eisenbergiella massiliensis]RGE63816.1 PhzF family phenazine biosynthesis protein [Eisenbergiella massiliensis]